MELYQLEAFRAVAAHGSFTRAADSLHLTQPAVTRQIAALEAELRTPLFDRLGRTVRLTAAGEALDGYAETILRTARDARAAVADVAAGAAGRLAVGASSTLATYVLPPALRRYREHRPAVEMSVHTGVSTAVLAMVRRGDVDLGLATSEVNDSALVHRDIAEFETRVVAPPSHPLTATASGVTAETLAGIPLILMEAGTNLRTYADRILGEAAAREHVAMEMDNVEAIKRMVEAGLGVSLLPAVSVAAEVQAGRLCALPLTGVPQAHRRVRLVYRRDKYLTAALREFIEVLEAELGASS